MQNGSPLDFPKAQDKVRLQRYQFNDKLYDGDQYEAFLIKGERDFSAGYNKLRYIVANFAGLMSKVMADMLFGETITLDVDDDKLQKFIDGLQEQNQLFTQLYESALANSRRGDSCFKIRIGLRNPADPQSSIIIEEFTPAIYFPALDTKAARNTPSSDVIAMVFTENGSTYLHVETHTPGLIEHAVYGYDPKEEKITSTEDVTAFGYQQQEETRVNRSLVFHVPNVRDGNGFWGTSDYKGLDSLFYALNNRITSVDNILDKHGDPILAVPPGVIDENGKVRKEALGMFEVDNENSGFNKPEYIVWDANLDSAFKEVDKLVDLLFMFSEIAPASLGADQGSGGQAESGRALKFKLLSTIRKRNRKMRYYDQAIKDMLVTAQELSKAWGVAVDGFTPDKTERPKVIWGDGVIRDNVEETETQVQRVEAGLQSRAGAIAALDDITPDEAKQKVKEIDAEQEPIVPPIDNGLNGNQNNGTVTPPNTDPNTNAPQPPQPARNPKNQAPAPQPGK